MDIRFRDSCPPLVKVAPTLENARPCHVDTEKSTGFVNRGVFPSKSDGPHHKNNQSLYSSGVPIAYSSEQIKRKGKALRAKRLHHSTEDSSLNLR